MIYLVSLVLVIEYGIGISILFWTILHAQNRSNVFDCLLSTYMPYVQMDGRIVNKMYEYPNLRTIV